MYVGRIVAVGRTRDGRNAALYRVSSRSFPNRQAVDLGGRLAIVPSPGAEDDVRKNPYIAYNALRTVSGWAIATNGTHTDPITEKVAAGMAPRDALALSLHMLDYEKDQLNTPRIAAAVPLRGDTAWLAIVREDALVVKAVRLAPGRAQYLATYETNDVDPAQSSDFDAATAADAARFTFEGGAFADLEEPVTAAAALAGGDAFGLGTYTEP